MTMVGQTLNLGNPKILSLKDPYGTLAFGFPDTSTIKLLQYT